MADEVDAVDPGAVEPADEPPRRVVRVDPRDVEDVDVEPLAEPVADVAPPAPRT